MIAKQGFATQGGIGVDASDRDALERRTLISTPNRERKARWLRPEEAGWTWTQEHLAKTLPPGQIALHNLTVRLDAHPRAKGGNLVDVIDTSPKAGQMDPALADVVDA